MSVSSGEGGHSRPLDALPKVFVDSMRTLFEIMDDRRTGYVHYSDIEERWRDEEGTNMPKGVLECLRKVTPASGLLSFERFVAGLKICLLRSRAEALSARRQQQPRPPSAPTLEPELPPLPPPPTVRPHSVIGQQRTLSMPQLSGEAAADAAPAPPPKPPRASGAARELSAAQLSRTQILTALQRWHRERVQRGRGDGGGDAALSSSEAEPDAPPPASAAAAPPRKAAPRKREPRRHTLQNGVDHNMLKRVKQLEQERATLRQGLQTVERAREWYLRQLATADEKMKYLGLGRSPQHSEHTTDANEERLSFQTARIHEVNQHLQALVDSSRRGFPLHMNLAVTPGRPTAASPTTERTVRRLRAQNSQLTEEVAQCSERITALEREKTSLIRELFNARSEPRPLQHPDETTLI